MPVPAVIKAKYIFSGVDHGWQEAHYFQQTSNDLSIAIARFYTTVGTRRLLLGAENSIKAIECSIETDTNGDPFPDVGAISYQDNVKGFQSEPACDPDLALVIKQANDIRTVKRNTFLRGFWDAIEGNGGQYIKGYGTWKSKYDAWVASLAALPTGWLHRTRSAPYPITTYDQELNDRVLITFAAPGPFGAGPTYPQRVSIRVNTNRQASVLKGELIVHPLSATTCETVNKIAVFPFTGTGWTARTFTVGFQQIAWYDDQKITRRAVGRPLLVSVGRQKAAARG